MSIPKDCNVFISLNQKDERMFMFSNQKHNYSYARLLIAKIMPSEIKYVGGSFGQEQVLTVDATLAQGDYLILVEIDWMQDIYNDVVISK